MPAPKSVTLHIIVSDTGPGIAPEDQERIFQPFMQANVSLSRSQQGTGLGLAITTELIGRMGGQIWVESDLGRGSRFHCTAQFGIAPLNIAEGQVDQQQHAPSVGESASHEARQRDASKARTLRVLLAEDTRANQKLVSAILAKRGHTVEIAHNGREAVEMIQQGEFDVVLMDVQMPNMDGFQATAAIRAFPQAIAKIPIIAMTAHAMRGDREKCLAAGMDGYISKPLDAGELVRVVEQLGRLRLQATATEPA